MKKSIFPALLLSCLALFAFKAITADHLAKPVSEDGYFIFHESTPVDEYTVLGEVKVSATLGGTYGESRKALIRKMKNDYPKADGIVISISKGLGADKGECIKFKN